MNDNDIKLLPLPEGEASSFGDYQVHDNEAMIEYARANVALNTALLRSEIEALRAEVERLRTDGASAVRWAPGSAYWSDVLRDLFGPDARNGIDVVEARWRKELERADKLAEALEEIRSRTCINEAMNPNPFALTAMLGDIHHIADTALAKEDTQ